MKKLLLLAYATAISSHLSYAAERVDEHTLALINSDFKRPRPSFLKRNVTEFAAHTAIHTLSSASNNLAIELLCNAQRPQLALATSLCITAATLSSLWKSSQYIDNLHGIQQEDKNAQSILDKMTRIVPPAAAMLVGAALGGTISNTIAETYFRKNPFDLMLENYLEQLSVRKRNS